MTLVIPSSSSAPLYGYYTRILSALKSITWIIKRLRLRKIIFVLHSKYTLFEVTSRNCSLNLDPKIGLTNMSHGSPVSPLVLLRMLRNLSIVSIPFYLCTIRKGGKHMYGHVLIQKKSWAVQCFPAIPLSPPF